MNTMLQRVVKPRSRVNYARTDLVAKCWC